MGNDESPENGGFGSVEIDGYVLVSDEPRPIYQNERFARALGLEPNTRDSRAEFVLVGPATFTMGCTDDDLERFEVLNQECDGILESAVPARVVEVAPFLLGRTLLTQGVWDGLANDLGIELWDQRVTEAPHIPVHGITWSYFVEVAEPLGLRLPTEAEWECAARGGAPNAFPWGMSKHSSFEHAWYAHAHEGGPMAVAQKRANPFGFFDMAGNLWELCADHWHDDYHEAPIDSRPWVADKNDQFQRVMRGGSFRSDSLGHLMCATRSSAGIYFSGDDLGVRPAASVLIR